MPFADRLLKWFDVHGRHDLPWQHPRTAYRVWLSEVMLQQTQVAAVIPYFERFLGRFPDLASLAAAPTDDVLQFWAGLGYYARARNLHRAAQEIVSGHGGEFPRDFEAVAALPGIGRSTAGAILAQAYGQRHAILDGNVKRVLARWGAVPGWPGAPKVQSQLWRIAESLLPDARFADYTQAMMDLGASLCTSRRPLCATCPVSADCRAFLEGRVAEFPAPKPKRERPLRRGRLLLLERGGGEWMVERRPPSGIWGGLWAPPVVMEGEDWNAALVRYQVMPAAAAVTWPSIHPARDVVPTSDAPPDSDVIRKRHVISVKPEIEPLQPAPDRGQELSPIHHGFTHFDLDLLPVRFANQQPAAGVAEPSDRMWIKLHAPEDWPALPAPLKKFFLSMSRQGSLLFEEPNAKESP